MNHIIHIVIVIKIFSLNPNFYIYHVIFRNLDINIILINNYASFSCVGR